MPTVHVIGNVLLIITFAFAGYLLARRRNTALIGICLSGFLAFLSVVMAVRPDLIVAVVPYRDMAFYDNMYPLAIVLFVPCAWRFTQTRPQRVRMVVWSALLFTMSLQPYNYHLAPLAKSQLTVIDDNGVCRQSSDYTCSAASVVTLLRIYGVECSEEDAIRLARTREGKGTESLGVYRALRHFADQVDGRDATLRYFAVDDLLQSSEPAIILVGLPGRGRAPNAASYGRQNNWMAGFYHDVVYLGLDPADDQRALIADPDMGIESWPLADLRFLFRGQAVMYEKQ